MRRTFAILAAACLMSAFLAAPAQALTIVTPGFAVTVPLYAPPPPPVYPPPPVFLAPAYGPPPVVFAPPYPGPPYLGPGFTCCCRPSCL